MKVIENSGRVIALSIGTMVPIAFLYAFVASKVWELFIMPVHEAIPVVGIMAFFGVTILKTLLFTKLDASKTSSDDEMMMLVAQGFAKPIYFLIVISVVSMFV